MTSLLLPIVVLPLIGFVINGLLGNRLGKHFVSLVACGLPIAAFAIAVRATMELMSTGAPLVQTVFTWAQFADRSFEIAFYFDRLTAVMALIVTGVGSLIHVYSTGYMHEDKSYARYFAYLNLFLFFMLMLVLGRSLLVLFVGWEGVGLASYLLIGFWFEDPEKAAAGKKAFITNRVGDAGFLIGMFLLYRALGTLQMDQINAAFLAGPVAVSASLVGLFLFIGATGKSAQIPLHVWLPDAMAGPTPVSALIHAATMVTAGVYLVARTNVLFALAPVSSTVVAGIGALTALFAATIGLRQYDIKKVLAYSTVSQLGYMFLGVGTGAITAGIFHLVTHAFFKALLFLGSGSVIYAMHHAYHATHSHEDAQDMRNMGGLMKYLPVTGFLMILATLAIAGIPPFSGFFSKDEILAFAFGRGEHEPAFRVFWAMGATAALLTAFYMARLIAMTFFGENRTGEREREHLHEAPWIMTGPLVILGLLTVFGGWLNLPEFAHGLGRPEGLHHWLEPVLAAGDKVAEGLGTVARLPEGSTETT